MPLSDVHLPVMVDEVVALFAPVPAGYVVDATAGWGGHAAAILAAHPQLRLVCLDRDPEAVHAASERLSAFGDRATVRHAAFDHLLDEAEAAGAEPGSLAGVLFDLGVSSSQLDTPRRGFSYRHDGPIDMRMDPTTGRTAAEVVNEWPAEALARLFAENGEGRFARRIARAVVSSRPLSSTTQLAEVVRTAIPAAARRHGGHPARRVFQALRTAVNDELGMLSRALPDALDALAPGGRCVALAYHSGEDRLVKSAFALAVSGGCTCPPGLPCTCGASPQGRLVFRGARRPTPAEVARNRRAESARMRAFERARTDLAERDLGAFRRPSGGL
ncbi:MAG TPA: 16S rRNA (cytosine(1402)-N(4))-methyltransferase RsmH [Acidimicrobiales bacterium]|nr:16S rRNA (cytosine(1402)-N(4))-methyltransferase RsmH [Acidimicrobiales bacterium]